MQDQALAPDASGPPIAPGRRTEFAFALAMLLCIIAIPLAWEKVFPFDRPSLFVASEHQYVTHRIRAPDGQLLAPFIFGLGDFYWGQGGYFSLVPGQDRGAVKLPPTIIVHGVIPTRSQVDAAIREKLALVAMPFVTVEQIVKGRVDDSGVGVLRAEAWRVSKPGRGDRR